MLCLSDVSRSYYNDGEVNTVLSDISFNISEGESCAIIGSSGSGKSTLLNIIGLLDRPTTGKFFLMGQDMSKISKSERAIIRNKTIGFVFQSFNLLPELNIVDNVALPLHYRGMDNHLAQYAAYEQLKNVGLSQLYLKKPADLSGGQRQRVAIARALVGNPSLLLADEPTGNLDSRTADNIVNLLLDLNREQSLTLIMVSHDHTMAGRMQRCLKVHNGQLLNG